MREHIKQLGLYCHRLYLAVCSGAMDEHQELENITGANAEENRACIKSELVQEDEPATIHWPSEDIGCQFSKGQVEVPGEYFFENDHLALLEEGGDDLQSLLRTLAVLEAQKVG